jgi:hypothetical protein
LRKRFSQVSRRLAPVDEVVPPEELYRARYEGWNVNISLVFIGVSTLVIADRPPVRISCYL